MGRSKEMGKPVSELTKAELKSEQKRLQGWLHIMPNKIAKEVLKRLRAVEKRLLEDE